MTTLRYCTGRPLPSSFSKGCKGLIRLSQHDGDETSSLDSFEDLKTAKLGPEPSIENAWSTLPSPGDMTDNISCANADSVIQMIFPARDTFAASKALRNGSLVVSFAVSYPSLITCPRK